jgi:hypothetical protein
MNQLNTIIRNSIRKDNDTYNILTFPTHERYQQGLTNTQAHYYLWHGPGIKTWNDNYGKLPQNHTLLNGNKQQNQLLDYINYDIIWSHQKFSQFQVAAQLATQLKLPLLSLEHTCPMPNWSKQQLKQLKNMRGDINVFITAYSRDLWGWKENEAEIIEHGVNTDLFDNQNLERQNYALIVCNDIINRSWCCGFDIFQQVTGFPQKQILPFKALGDTPGFSRPAQNIEELVLEYNTCGVFLNTATQSPIPSVMLEAMSCGATPVSMRNGMIDTVIINGINGFASNKPQELREYCQLLLKDKNLAIKMGIEARKTILERFKLDKFVTKWNDVFQRLLKDKV